MAPRRRQDFSSETQGASMQVPNFALKGWISRPKEVVLSSLIPHYPWLVNIIWLDIVWSPGLNMVMKHAA